MYAKLTEDGIMSRAEAAMYNDLEEMLELQIERYNAMKTIADSDAWVY